MERVALRDAVKRWSRVARNAAPVLPAVSEWAGRVLGFEADAVQKRVLDCGGRRVMLNCSRQWGKSTVTAVRVLYEMYWRPGTLVAVVGPAEQQVVFFVQKVKALAERRLGERVWVDPRAAGRTGVSVRLGNGSALVGVAAREATSRGLSGVDFLIVDEAARVPDEVYYAVRPFLATTGGKLWLLSTPDGQAGFFHDEWHDERAEWERIATPATACGRIPAAFLEEEKRAMGEHQFAQEYLCKFLKSRSQLIPRGLVARAVRPEEAPLDVRTVFGEE